MDYVNERTYVWSKITLSQFAAHVQGKKTIKPVVTRINWSDAYGILLDDKTVCVAISQFNGPLSEVTPDIDAEEPEYFLGVPC